MDRRASHSPSVKPNQVKRAVFRHWQFFPVKQGVSAGCDLNVESSNVSSFLRIIEEIFVC
jgi:hypothetical protein